MHIALIGCKETLLDYLPDLKERISSRIAGAKITLTYAQKVSDLPFEISRQSKADFILVSHIYETAGDSFGIVMQKIMDLRISKNLKLWDDIEQNSDISESPGIELQNEKSSRTEKWAKIIIAYFFGGEKEKTSDEIEFGSTRMRNPDVGP